MGYQLTQSEEHPLAELSYHGEVLPAELLRSVNETFEFMQRRALSRVLTDCSGMKGGHSVFDLLAGIDKVLENITPGNFRFREAVLLPAQASEESQQNVRFWETACQNRGLNIQVFHDRKDATDWLLKLNA